MSIQSINTSEVPPQNSNKLIIREGITNENLRTIDKKNSNGERNLGKNLYKLPCWYYHSLRFLYNISSISLSSGRTILYDLSHF